MSEALNVRIALVAAVVAVAGCSSAQLARDSQGRPLLARAEGIAARTQAKPGPAEVISWTKQGLAPASIVDRLRQASPRIRMDGAMMERLRTQEVDVSVLDHLVEADRRANDADLAEETTRRLTAEAKLREQQQARLPYIGAPYRPSPWGPWPGGYGPRFGSGLMYRHHLWR